MAPQQEPFLSSILGRYGKIAVEVATNPAYTIWIAPILFVADAVLCALIIKLIPYTEIDWKAYMQQIEQVVAGERKYPKIHGDTGPLVYPAIHVYIYRVLYAMTDSGKNILLAQVYFAIVYLFNLGLVMACYRLASAPPWVYPMLVLSKRLHSIYVLRCFNDCFAVTAFFLAILLFQKKHWAYGAIAYSAGVGIKMSLLVALPAVAVILYQALGPTKAMTHAMYMFQVQFLSGLPFLSNDARGYVYRAFDLSRQFKYEWTVNWRFMSEEVFLSRRFSVTLLIVHASLLGLFISTRWLRPLGRSPRDIARLAFANPSDAAQAKIVRALSSDFILTTMLTSMAIGMLCARTLHYQFFAYIAWATPFLLWRAKLNPLLQIFLWVGQEMSWNVFPSVELSSKVVVGVLAAMVVEVWLATDEETQKTDAEKRAEAELRVQQDEAMQKKLRKEKAEKRSVEDNVKAGSA